MYKYLLLLLIPILLYVSCKKDDDEVTTPAPLSITVTAPNGGENWRAGSAHNIVWTDNGVTTVTLRMSIDNGTTWTDIVAAQANNHSYAWTVPASVSTGCRVSVVDASNALIIDQSDRSFAITSATAPDNATYSFRSDESGIIETPDGARMIVPVGAVPRTEQDSVGTMLFSIERDTTTQITPVSGETVKSHLYRFGPEGFVLARPVMINIPVLGTDDPGEVKIWRINSGTGLSEYYGASYDPVTRMASAQTYQFSPWYDTGGPRRSTAAGCANVSNGTGKWLSLCVDSVSLAYPVQDAPVIPELSQGVVYAPQGTIGWATTGDWYLPQGFYRVCASVEGDNHKYYHKYYEFTLTTAWEHDNPVCHSLGIGAFVDADTGQCVCNPQVTTSVGTGDIQVTLTWREPQPGLDLDLWVTDPNGERCYYANNPSPSGGALDRDNRCGNYEDGRPENIYWTRTPPIGEYVVYVDWFGACQGSGTITKDFNVRAVVSGVTHSAQGTVTDGGTMEAMRFSFTGDTTTFMPMTPHPIVSSRPRAAKN